MSDVQPMLFMEDVERGVAFHREELGFDVTVFGYHSETSAPLIAGAKLEDAFIMLTREELFRADGSIGSGPARLYFHPGRSVEELDASTANQPDIRIVQQLTDQHWGDRTVIVRDPWDVLMVFSNPVG